jgi:hypothetical protein
MVSRGVGVAVVPDAAFRTHRGRPALSSVRLTDAWALRHLNICARSLSDLPAHAQQLVQHLSSLAAQPEQ